MKKPKKGRTTSYELDAARPLSPRQKRELEALAKRAESDVDTSEIPELPRDAWKQAVRGKWYRPRKTPVSLRLDSDVLAWLKAKGSGYQTRANALLREKMLEDTRR